MSDFSVTITLDVRVCDYGHVYGCVKGAPGRCTHCAQHQYEKHTQRIQDLEAAAYRREHVIAGLRGALKRRGRK